MRKIIFLAVAWGLIFLIADFKSAFSEEKSAVVVPTPLTKNVGDYYVSIGIFSIEDLKKSFPRAYKLLARYHGEPSKNDTHHLAVSIWKQDGGKMVYLSDLRVEAEVRSPIFRAVRKKLGKYPHQYGDNYGGWFDMSDKGLYHIAVIIKEDGKNKRVDFDYLVQ